MAYSLKYHCKEMYRDQSVEFGFGCRLLHWLAIFLLILSIYYCVLSRKECHKTTLSVCCWILIQVRMKPYLAT